MAAVAASLTIAAFVRAAPPLTSALTPAAEDVSILSDRMLSAELICCNDADCLPIATEALEISDDWCDANLWRKMALGRAPFCQQA